MDPLLTPSLAPQHTFPHFLMVHLLIVVSWNHPNMDELYKMIQHRQVQIPTSFSEDAQDIITGLLKKKPCERLGCTGDETKKRDHNFFVVSINWADLEQEKVSPPFQPSAGRAEEAGHLYAQFTHQATDLAQLSIKQDVRKIVDECFREFSFYNEN